MNIQFTKPNNLRSKEDQKSYVYRHTVSFEETNVVGNVYFSRHLAWQGRCREMFLKEKAPETLSEIYGDLRLVTLNVGCEYFQEFHAFDEIDIHMRLKELAHHRISLGFSYFLSKSGEQVLAALGHQDIGCMRLFDGELKPVTPPLQLKNALNEYREPAL